MMITSEDIEMARDILYNSRGNERIVVGLLLMLAGITVAVQGASYVSKGMQERKMIAPSKESFYD